MTVEELLALPDDGVRRWLIKGELREEPTEGANQEPPVTVRNRVHCEVMSNLATALTNWKRTRPAPRGRVLCGEAGVLLSPDDETAVGVDVVYVQPELAARQTGESTVVNGVPTLMVEILSPSSTEERTNEKIDAYMEAGVPLVWIIDPHDRTVTVYRPGAEPELFPASRELTAEPHLPGFRVPVAELFG
jgi:Uma2 family endonuclease